MKRRCIPFIMGIIIIILCIGFGISLYRGRGLPDASGGGIQLEQNAEDWNKDIENASGEAKGIKIPGYGEITVTASSERMKMSLVNPEDNPCYFQFILTAEENGEEKKLYESGLVEPGKAVKEFDLEYLPPKGDYDMLVKINTYSLEDGTTPMNGAEVKTILHVVE